MEARLKPNAVYLYFGERGIGRCTGCFKAHEAYDVEVEDLVRAQVLACGRGKTSRGEVELD